MQNFGVNPVHFGMIMLLNLGIGPVPSAGRINPVSSAAQSAKSRSSRFMRKNLAVLRGHVPGVDVRHLYSRNIPVACRGRCCDKLPDHLHPRRRPMKIVDLQPRASITGL